MTRNEFLKSMGRYGLLALISMIVFFLGNKVVTGKSCESCPGNGICNGETDCDNY